MVRRVDLLMSYRPSRAAAWAIACALTLACAQPPSAIPPASATSTAPPAPASPATASVATATARAATGAPADSATGATAGAAIGPALLVFKALELPGAPAPVSLDYLAYEPSAARVWVPVGDTGSVDVLDIASGRFARVDGFKTAEREAKGRKRMMGPSAATVGDGTVYVGDRASQEVCAVDAKRLALGACLKLPSVTDGVAYVASTREVWVTTPRDASITVLDATRPDALRMVATIKLDGAPEGYAVDDARGLFVTNLEDKDMTLAIDVKTRHPRAIGSPGCGPDGPRGIAAEHAHGFVFVACTDHVAVLDPGHGGEALGSLDTGAGVDNIDWLEARRLLFAGAAKAGRLTVARVDEAGRPTIVATGDTPQGARNPVADAEGNAYEADPANGRILVFPHAP
jgi:hypothetical protein